MTLLPRFLIHTVLAGVTVIAGCAYNPVDVAILAPEYTVSSLAGEWTGHYSGSGRSGSIAFRFEAGDTLAFGDVLMIPRENVRPGKTIERTGVSRQLPSLLTIVFIGDAAGRVSGTLDPYVDPDCDCVVITEFFGQRISGSELKGTFMTRVTGTAIIQSGKWSVKRQDRTR